MRVEAGTDEMAALRSQQHPAIDQELHISYHIHIFNSTLDYQGLPL